MSNYEQMAAELTAAGYRITAPATKPTKTFVISQGERWTRHIFIEATDKEEARSIYSTGAFSDDDWGDPEYMENIEGDVEIWETA